ncbi:MAG: hypothetical protein AAF654_02100 [Myxococcota bacterium]
MRFAVLLALLPASALAYPTDPSEQERTEIRRLKWQQDINSGERRGRKVPTGAQWSTDRIELKLLEQTEFELTAETSTDPELQDALEKILKRSRFRRYNIAVLDITDPNEPRLAAVNGTRGQTPGSVAKVLVAGALFNELAKRFPNDVAARERLLREHSVSADDWAMPNHHEVPVVKGERTSIRKVYKGDTFTLWEWIDHALSPSSNASASMVWREATLMRLMGEEYPPAEYGPKLYSRWDRETWTTASFDAVTEPIVRAGLDPELFFLKMYFTKNANRYIRSAASRATPIGVVAWMVKVEQGKMIDRWSSQELKKMLYLTRRRVRYLGTRKLDAHAAFFKSGSLYQCKPEPGYTCIAYQGNVVNVLNSLVEIETAPPPPDESSASPEPFTPEVDSPAPERYRPHVYIVAVMSNELKRNAAMDHARLAEQVHAVITGEK